MTTDKNIKRPHNLEKLPLSVIEFDAVDTRIEGLLPFAPFCAPALQEAARYRFISIRPDGAMELLGQRESG